MDPVLLCSYCPSMGGVSCNCSSSQVLLCQQHAFQHVKDLPEKVHNLQDLYLPLEPKEREAFLFAQTFLFDAERTKEKKMTADHSRDLENILRELAKTTSELVRKLRETNQTHLNNITYLNKNVREMRATLNEAERLGVPTFKRDEFSIRLEALRKNTQVIAHTDLLNEIKIHWEQQGMHLLSHLFDAQEYQTHSHIIDQLRFTEIRKHPITGGDDISFSPDGQYIIAGSDDKTIKIWNLEDGGLLHSLVGHISRVNTVSFSPDSKYLASGSEDKMIRLWRVSSGQTIKQLEAHSEEVNSVVFSNDGEFIASGSDDKTVKVWRTKPGFLKKYLLYSFSGHSNWVCSVCFSHDDRLLASGSRDESIKIWDLSSAKEKWTLLSSNCGAVYSVCFARNSALLVSGSADKTVKLWNGEDGELLHTFHGHLDLVLSVAFSPDGQFIASGSHDKTVKLWKVTTRSLKTTFEHSSFVVDVKFSPDGLILASRDKTELELLSLL